MHKKFTTEIIALAVAVGAAVAGVAYYLYISAVDFPAGAARAVPIIWLLTAISGWLLAARSPRKSSMYWVVVALSIPSVLLALLFTLGALMGD